MNVSKNLARYANHLKLPEQQYNEQPKTHNNGSSRLHDRDNAAA